MNEAYIATFYSHFGAMAFHKKCKEAGFKSRIMPVPRALSSSCGTCVWFTGDCKLASDWGMEELEQMVKCVEKGGYEKIL
nr:DUF3343 domain-containing protein [uncultured Blautia sp.]